MKKQAAIALIGWMWVGGISGCVTVKKPETAPPAPLAAEQTFAPEARNTEKVQASPYVVLVSLDGFRHDYAKRYQAPNLLQMAREGVSAKGLIPVYPSKTFPNHYSIITGLYANHHGIVSNEFFDPERRADYAISKKETVADGSWYGGEPLWNVVEKQGGVTASYFWVGSEAAIQGLLPNHYFRYNPAVPADRRVAQVLEWLQLPPDRRPHFITLYFSDVDDAGHEFGPDASETRQAVLKIDEAIGKLRAGLDALKLPINFIVVSDHGMEKVGDSPELTLSEDPALAAKLTRFKIRGQGPQLLLYLNPGEPRTQIAETARALERFARTHGNAFRVRQGTALKPLHYDGNPRTGDLVIEVRAPSLVRLKPAKKDFAETPGGAHGWNPQKTPSMQGIFYAVGPAFKSGFVMPAFENIHVFPLVLDILRMHPLVPIDGRLATVRRVLRQSRQ